MRRVCKPYETLAHVRVHLVAQLPSKRHPQYEPSAQPARNSRPDPSSLAWRGGPVRYKIVAGRLVEVPDSAAVRARLAASTGYAEQTSTPLSSKHSSDLLLEDSHRCNTGSNS